MSDFMDPKMAKAAVAIVSFLVRALFRGPAKRKHGHIIVGLRSPDGKEYEILAQKSFGRRREWLHAFDKIARDKFMLSVRTGLDSREVQTNRPELLRITDTMFWGSAVLGPIVVAFSGVQPWFDEAISYALAHLLRALAQDRVEELKSTAMEVDADRYDGEMAH